MKIGINLIHFYELTGIAIYTKNLLKNIGILDSKNEYYLFTNNNLIPDLNYNYSNFNYIKLPIGRSKAQIILGEQILLPFYASKFKIDILFTPNVFCPKISLCPQIVTIHDLGFLGSGNMDLKEIYLRFCSKNSANAKKIITISDFSKKQILSYFPKIENKIKVIYLGVPETIQPLRKESEILNNFKINKPYFFYVGLMVPHKNIENNIKAFKKFLKKENNFLFVLAGNERKELLDVKKIIRDYGLEANVLFVGRISEEEKTCLYKNSQGLIFTSRHEGFGLPILEAQSFNVPVLASNVTSLPEIGGNGALYVDPHNVEDIAKGMERIVFDEELRNYLIEEGCKNVNDFSWEKTAKETIKAIESIKNENSSSK